MIILNIQFCGEYYNILFLTNIKYIRQVLANKGLNNKHPMNHDTVMGLVSSLSLQHMKIHVEDGRSHCNLIQPQF